MGGKEKKILNAGERLCWLTYQVHAEPSCNWNVPFVKFIGSWGSLLLNWSINLFFFFNELGDFLLWKITRKPDQMPTAWGKRGLNI